MDKIKYFLVLYLQFYFQLWFLCMSDLRNYATNAMMEIVILIVADKGLKGNEPL